MKSAYDECKELNKKYGMSWYKNIVYLVEKLKVYFEKIKKCSREKLQSNRESNLKYCQQKKIKVSRVKRGH